MLNTAEELVTFANQISWTVTSEIQSIRSKTEHLHGPKIFPSYRGVLCMVIITIMHNTIISTKISLLHLLHGSLLIRFQS